MVSLTQVEKLHQLKSSGWHSPGAPHPDPMKQRIGGPTLILDADDEPHYVYADGRVVPLVPRLTPPASSSADLRDLLHDLDNLDAPKHSDGVRSEGRRHAATVRRLLESLGLKDPT